MNAEHAPSAGGAGAEPHPSRQSRPGLSGEPWNRVASSLKLSVREREITELIFVDSNEKAIAQALGISPRTVHGHIEHLYCKLGVNSRCGLIARVFATYVTMYRLVESNSP